MKFVFLVCIVGILVTLGVSKGITISTSVNARTGDQQWQRQSSPDSDDDTKVIRENTTSQAFDLHGRRLQTTPVSELTDDPDRMDIELFIEPKNGTFSPTGYYFLW